MTDDVAISFLDFSVLVMTDFEADIVGELTSTADGARLVDENSGEAFDIAIDAVASTSTDLVFG